MPLLIFHCRTRLFLAFVQQRAILGGAPTLTVPGRANEFHTDSPPNSVFKIIHLFKFKVKQIKCVYCQMLKYFYEKAFRDRGSGFVEISSYRLWDNCY